MTKRRPVTIVDIANVIGISVANTQQMIKGLKAKGKLKEKQYQKEKYYSYYK
jgi:Mn-dependent DtxR family transcriptional regulator